MRRWIVCILALALCGCAGRSGPLAALCAQGLNLAVVERNTTHGSVEVTDAQALKQLSDFLETFALRAGETSDAQEPVLIFVLYGSEGDVSVLLTYPDGQVEIDGDRYLADERAVTQLDALGWSLLYP